MPMKKFVFITFIALILVGCKKAAQNTTTESSPQSSAMQYGAASPAEAMTAGKMTVNLADLNNSGQTGTATLEESNGKVMVTINLSGGNFAQPQPAHIHTGSCPAPGGVKYPLTNVVNGKSETTLDTTLEALKAASPLAINIHKSQAEQTVYTACGDLKS